MGRGSDNLLGFAPKAKRAKKEKKRDTNKSENKRNSNILFQPIKRQDNNLYRLNPTAAAIRRAQNIAQDMKEGNYLSFLMILESGDLDFQKYPAFVEIFQNISGDEINKLLRKRKIPRRGKEAKAEREFLEDNSANFLALRIQKALLASQDMPASERAAQLEDISFIDDDFIAEISLTYKEGGPAKDYYLNSLRKRGMKDMQSGSLQFLLDNKSDEAEDIFQELMRRESASIFHSLIGREGLTPELDYGCIRISYRGSSVLHIKGPGFGTLCGSQEGMYPSGGVVYGSWSDAPYSDDFKRCPKCVKAADEATLKKLDAEGSDMLNPWIDKEGQEKMQEIARDPRLKRIARKALAEGDSMKDVRDKIKKHMAMHVADVFADAADKYRQGDNFVYHSGGAHAAWIAVDHNLRAKLRNLGYTVPHRLYGASTFKRGEAPSDLLDEDILLKATSAEERRKYFRYRTRALLANADDREKYLEQGQTIINRAVRRFLRQEKNGSRS